MRPAPGGGGGSAWEPGGHRAVPRRAAPTWLGSQPAARLARPPPAWVPTPLCSHLPLHGPQPPAGDANTTVDAVAALLAFYQRFPAFANSSLFLAGQGYAGGCAAAPRGPAVGAAAEREGGQQLLLGLAGQGYVGGCAGGLGGWQLLGGCSAGALARWQAGRRMPRAVLRRCRAPAGCTAPFW